MVRKGFLMLFSAIDLPCFHIRRKPWTVLFLGFHRSFCSKVPKHYRCSRYLLSDFLNEGCFFKFKRSGGFQGCLTSDVYFPSGPIHIQQRTHSKVDNLPWLEQRNKT